MQLYFLSFIPFLLLCNEIDTNQLITKAQHFYKQKNIKGAITFYKAAHYIKPNDISIIFQIGYKYGHLGKFEKEIEWYNKILQKNSNVPGVFNNKAIALKSLGRYDEAFACAQHSLKLKSNSHNPYYTLRDYSLAKGQLDQAWEYDNLIAQLKAKDSNAVIDDWSEMDFSGKRILLYDHNGYGDLFHWIRYAKLLKERGAYVIVKLRPQIIPFMQEACNFFDEIIPLKTEAPEHDYYCWICLLYRNFKTTIDTIPDKTPYLFANKNRVEEWQSFFEPDSNFKIGICWTSNTYLRAGSRIPYPNTRSIPLGFFEQLTKLPYVSVYSLQKINGEGDLKNCSFKNKIKIIPGLDKDGRFLDTAAIMHYLDLVITCDTSIAHLAGAMAIPVWTILPYAPDWRWFLDRKDTPWYPTMRLFRPKKYGDWSEPFGELIHKLTQSIQA